MKRYEERAKKKEVRMKRYEYACTGKKYEVRFTRER